MATIMRLINTISRSECVYRNDKCADSDLNPVHFSYLLAICNNPGFSQEELARHICVNKSNITRNLAYLEKSGYVERKQHEKDKRVLIVTPTKKAFDILPKINKIVIDWNEYLISDISEEELKAFHKTLERISSCAKKYVSGEDGPKE